MASNFHKANLRGCSFEKKDLTGEDFSSSDIRGANFTGAILTQANFKKSKSGIKPIAILVLAIGSTILMVLTGLVAGYAGAFPAFITSLLAEESGFEKNLLVVAGSGILVGFMVVIVRRGLGASLGILAISLAVVTAVVGFAGTGNLLAAAWVQAIAIATAVGGVLMGALAVAIFMTVTSSRLLVISVFAAILGATPGALEGIKKPANMPGFPPSIALAMTGMMAFALLSLSLYVGMQSLSGNRKYAIIQTLVVNLCTALGTQFRGATLTDADFSEAMLLHADFRGAGLKRTNWFQVNGLEQSRVEGTYLANEAVRQLAITKNGLKNSVYNNENMRELNLQNAHLEGASFIGADLGEANLQNAHLEGASFIGADLSNASLQNAHLEESKLVDTQLYRANISGAFLTGACIQNWGISTETNFDNVECGWVYMKLLEDGNKVRRKPDDDDDDFEKGEFSAFIAPLIKTLSLYQKQFSDPSKIGRIETLDFRHHKDDNHKAIIFALTKLASKHTDVVFEVVSVYSVEQNMINVGVAVTSGIAATTLSSQYKKYFEQYSHLSEQEKQETLSVGHEEQIEKLKRLLSTICESPGSYIGASITIVIDKSQKIDFTGAKDVVVGDINQVAADTMSNAFNSEET